MILLKRFVFAITFLLVMAGLSAAGIPLDSIGEGTVLGWIPMPADTVRDTSFHVGDTIRLQNGDMIVKLPAELRVEAAMPSVKTTVRIVVGDGFATGVVKQTFRNPFDLPFEAQYVFPLPNKGAIHGMTFRTSTGTFRADIESKDTAIRQYEDAKAQGKQASLLLQAQENIFVQKLCNILPHDSVSVSIEFSMPLTYDMGTYELAFPTVVGPRFDPIALPKRTNNPLYIPPSTRSGGSLDFVIAICTPYEVSNLVCPSHESEIDSVNAKDLLNAAGMMASGQDFPLGIHASVIRLAARETIPNRDIVVRFTRKDSKRDVSVVSCHDGKQGYFGLQIYPDMTQLDTAKVPVDMVFVIDISGSMGGWPLQKEKEVMNAMLDKAKPEDRLYFVAFSDLTYEFKSTPVYATAENITAARNWVNSLQTLGGTEMLQGVLKGLSMPVGPGRMRIMSLLTDGYIGDIDSIYHAIANDPNKTIPFTFGIGSSVNRALIDGAAQAGNGIAKTVLLSDDISSLVDDFWKRIRTPQLTDLSIDWGGDVPTNLTLSSIGNLWYGQPIVLFGQYRDGGARTITLKGKRNGVGFQESYPIQFTNNNMFMKCAAQMWAREMIEQLVNKQVAQGTTVYRDSITKISLAYNVLCEYTAFIAIADSVVNENGQMVSTEVPVYVPQGVDGDAAGAQYYPTTGTAGSWGPAVDVIHGQTNTLQKHASSTTINCLFIGKDKLSITFHDVQKGKQLSVCIYDMRGRLLMRWSYDELLRSHFSVVWDLRDFKGNKTCAGSFIIAGVYDNKRMNSIIYHY